MSLQRRREKLIISYVWKIKNKKVPNDIHLEFTENNLRSCIKAILKPMPKIKGRLLTLYENSFEIRACKLWNKLPSSIANIDNFNTFQIKLEDYLKLYPDSPPIRGYYHSNSNSLLDYQTINI